MADKVKKTSVFRLLLYVILVIFAALIALSILAVDYRERARIINRYEMILPDDLRQYAPLAAHCHVETNAITEEQGFYPFVHTSKSCLRLKKSLDLKSPSIISSIASINPNNYWDYQAWANLAQNMDEYEISISILEALSVKHPAYNVFLAIDYLRAGNLPRAVPLLREACAQKFSRACYALAQAECSLGKREDALRNIQLAEEYINVRNSDHFTFDSMISFNGYNTHNDPHLSCLRK